MLNEEGRWASVTWAVTGHRRGAFGRELKYLREDGCDWINLAVHTEDW